jgi:hypothetical protein
MAKLSRPRVAIASMAGVLLTAGIVHMGGTSAAQQPKVNPDAKLLQDFQQRIEKYVELRNQLKKGTPKLKETRDPAEIQASQDALAAKLRSARGQARQGEIFTPEIAGHFRKLLRPEMKGPDAAETKKTIKEDAPAGVALKVNAKFPEDEPLPTVPPNVLARLPRLPEDLEYRIVRNALILRDVHANLIVDFMLKAIP